MCALRAIPSGAISLKCVQLVGEMLNDRERSTKRMPIAKHIYLGVELKFEHIDLNSV